MTPDEERILEKVRRLFELAKSSNEHESAAAAAKAQELLHKYNLERGDIPVEKDSPYVKETVKARDRDEWRGTLMNILAKANGASVIFLGNGTYDVIGQKHVIEVVLYSYDQMQRRVTLLTDTMWEVYMGPPQDMREFKYAFRIGVLDRLRERLKRNKAEMMTTPESQALVVRDDERLRQAVAQWYPRLTNVKRASITSLDGYMMGKMAGDGLNVNPGLHGARGQRRLQ